MAPCLSPLRTAPVVEQTADSTEMPLGWWVEWAEGTMHCCRDHAAADAADPLVVSLSGCYGDDEAILMWKLINDDVSQ